MNNPFPNMNVSFETKSYNLSITDLDNNTIRTFSSIKNVTNYEYEVQKNEEKRQILILKPEYLGAFIQDMKNIMKYDKASSQAIDEKTKKVYNSKLKGV